jgi:hypothetical protein
MSNITKQFDSTPITFNDDGFFNATEATITAIKPLHAAHEDDQRHAAKLEAEIERLKKAAAPVARWWRYVEMRAEIADETMEDIRIALQCMHSGGSVGVTVGELRALTAALKN